MATQLAIVVPKPKGTWNSSTSYNPLNIVTYEGRSYICKQSGAGVAPAQQGNIQWQLMSDKGESLSYSDLTDAQKADIAATANSAALAAQIAAEEAAASAEAVRQSLEDFSSSGDVNAQTIAKVATLESKVEVIEGRYLYSVAVSDNTDYPEFSI